MKFCRQTGTRSGTPPASTVRQRSHAVKVAKRIPRCQFARQVHVAQSIGTIAPNKSKVAPKRDPLRLQGPTLFRARSTGHPPVEGRDNGMTPVQQTDRVRSPALSSDHRRPGGGICRLAVADRRTRRGCQSGASRHDHYGHGPHHAAAVARHEVSRSPRKPGLAAKRFLIRQNRWRRYSLLFSFMAIARWSSARPIKPNTSSILTSRVSLQPASLGSTKPWTNSQAR